MEENIELKEAKLEILKLEEQKTGLQTNIESMKEVINEATIVNYKLALITRLFAEIHFTKDEKLKIAEEIDKTKIEEAASKVYEKYFGETKAFSRDDDMFMWSPAFTRELDKYYSEFRGYDPLEKIRNFFSPIRTYFSLSRELNIMEEGPKKEKTKELFRKTFDQCQESSENIIRILNETQN